MIFQINKPLTGTNESRQYNATLSYLSSITGFENKILIEVSLREKHLLMHDQKQAHTLLTDAFTGDPKVDPYLVNCLPIREAYAEKVRAALCRERVAIRDYYDIDYAMRHNVLQFENPDFIKLVKSKISLKGNEIRNLQPEITDVLMGKIDEELFPTLNDVEKQKFDLHGTIELLKRIKSELEDASK